MCSYLFYLYRYLEFIETVSQSKLVKPKKQNVSEFPAEGRDDWFWDEHFWRYPHMMRLECPDGYGWEGEYMDGECHVCEAGHYSASWGPTVRCLPCPPGTYSKDSALSHECIKCPQLTPISEAGSGSRSDCHAMAKTLEGDLTATVEVTISASGDYTFLNDMLSELSGYEAHEMSAQVEYVILF